MWRKNGIPIILYSLLKIVKNFNTIEYSGGTTIDGAIRLVERQQGVVAGIAAIAIEENERTLGYRNQYPCASAVVPGSTWQTQCNAQFLDSFNSYDASKTYPKAGRV